MDSKQEKPADPHSPSSEPGAHVAGDPHRLFAEETPVFAQIGEEQFRFLADAIPEMVWTARPDGQMDYYNQRWFDYTGMTLEQTQDWGAVLHLEERQSSLS